MTPATSAPAVEEQATSNTTSGSAPAPSPAPSVKNIRNYDVVVPAGASREVTVEHRAVDWTDGAQTVRENFGPWICIHAGACWPDAVTECKHIELLTGGRS